MNDELKAVRNLGAELGAAKAENEKLREIAEDAGRELQAWIASFPRASHHQAKALIARISGALSQQADHSEDVLALVESAPAQDDGRSAFKAYLGDCAAHDIEPSIAGAFHSAWHGRPAQTEQQPVVPAGFRVMWPTSAVLADSDRWEIYAPCGSGGAVSTHDVKDWVVQSLLDAMASADTTPQGKFRMGDLVKKSSGSEWEGRVVGWYRTEQTAEGYAVESSAHRNSVQIYPAKALELVPMAAKEA